MLLRRVDLGRMSYGEAYAEQVRQVGEVLASRDAGRAEVGRVLVVEHDPVITVSRRSGAAGHVLATPEMLARQGVTIAETDRGGDVTYHGPGQLVVYPILDLNVLNLGLHAYMRLLEQAVIDVCAALGIPAQRDASATGVWVEPAGGGPMGKIAAMGVRVRRWVSMHGLAINLDPDWTHFQLLVPCGLHGRPVTSVRREAEARGRVPPTLEALGTQVVECLDRACDRALEEALLRRKAAGDDPVAARLC